MILNNKDNIKNIITSKFKDKLWDDKELKGKGNVRYYKVVMNLNLESHNYIYVWVSARKKMNIDKARTNSHELQSETGHWSIPKTPWMKESITFVIPIGLKMKNAF